MLSGSTPMVNDAIGCALIASGKAVIFDSQPRNSNDKSLDAPPKDKMVRRGDTRRKSKVD